MQAEGKKSITKYKFLYTLMILSIYLLGRSLPLYDIDIYAYKDTLMNMEMLLFQAIGGDSYQYSILVLGISPYMLSSILIQIALAMRPSESKSKISPKSQNWMQLSLTLTIAFVQALMHLDELHFTTTGDLVVLTKVVAVIEMVTGVMIIIWLVERNKQYGIGGQTTLIYVNILDGMMATLKGYEVSRLILPLLISLAVMFVMLLMENTEKRIPVQRISIHNIYADKNYLAIKMNPIGAMPVMFSTAVFMLPQMLLFGLGILFPENEQIVWLTEQMDLSKPLGIGVYTVILYLLTIGFSMVFISPRDLTEQFLKSGDCIVNLHAGKDTKRYLTRTVLRISFLSATVMSICIVGPMILQQGNEDQTLMMLPSSMMMLTGIWCNLYQEYISIRNYEEYKPFI